MSFEANHGQTDSQVKFLTRGSGYTLFLTSTEAVLALHKNEVGNKVKDEKKASDPSLSSVLRLKLLGASSTPQIVGRGELPGKSNYLIGNDPTKWRTGIPNYTKVECQAIYPGVDLVYYGNQRQLEYDFVVAPGAYPGVIKIGFEGIEKLGLEAQGDLVLHLSGGEVRLRKPLVYQEVDGVRREVPSGYVRADQHQIGFQVGEYDVSKPLVIDPIIVYSSYLGGSGADQGNSIAVDANGNAYVTGQTFSTNFPTRDSQQATFGGASDVFVAKLNVAGSALVYSTYLGGVGNDQGFGITVDIAGNAYVTGPTFSADFPTANAMQSSKTSSAAFKSTNGGSSWSAISAGLTANSVEEQAIAVDPTNPSTLYVGTPQGIFKSTNSGITWSASSTGLLTLSVRPVVIDPITPSTLYAGTFNSGIYKSTNGAGSWIAVNTGLTNFVIRSLAIDPKTPATLYAGASSGVFKSTNGGTSWSISNTGLPNDNIWTIAIDPSTPSTVYAVSGIVWKSTNGGSTWSAAGNGLTNLGVRTMVIDPTAPTTLYASTTRGLFKSINGGNSWNETGLINIDVYSMVAIDPTTSTALYAGTVKGLFKSIDGGSSWNAGSLTGVRVQALAIDRTNPSTLYAGTSTGGDAFVTKLNTTGNALIYSTYLGGTDLEQGRAIAVDTSGNAYVTGQTLSPNFPTLNPLQPINPSPGLSRGFVAKFSSTGSLVYSTYLGGTNNNDAGNGIAVDSAGNAYITGEVGSTDFPTANPLQPTRSEEADAFVTKLNSTGSALVYSTYLGGSRLDRGRSIAIDAAGNAYVTGETLSSNFPTANSAQPTLGGGTCGASPCSDAFVAKLNPAGSALVYSTYLGGSNNEQGFGIAVDTDGNAYVTGRTDSENFPTANPVQAGLGGFTDAFVMKLNPLGSFIYSTYLGGLVTDQGISIAVDAVGDAYVLGLTTSNDFPVVNPLQPATNGFGDVFITKIADTSSPSLAVQRIVPNKGGDTGPVSVVIYGRAFVQGTKLKLARAGQPDIVGNPVQAGASGLSIVTSFDLTGKARALWDVVVTNPDGTSATLPQGFSIEEGRASQLWVDILGQDQIRVGRQTTFQIVYGNSGNLDWDGLAFIAVFVPVGTETVLVKYNNLTVGQFTPKPALPSALAGLSNLSSNAATNITSGLAPDGRLVGIFSLPHLKAASLGSPYSITFTPLQSPSATGAIEVELFQVPPTIFLPTPAPPRMKAPGEAVRILIEAKFREFGLPSPAVDETFRRTLEGAIADALNESARELAMGAAANITLARQSELLKGAVNRALDRLEPDHSDAVKTYRKTWDLLIQPANFQLFESALYANWKDITALPITDDLKKKAVQFVISRIPHAKVGSQGTGIPQYLSGEELFRYAIYFENVETATTPVREVAITDQLDVGSFDLSTFSFGPINFGDRQVVPPLGVREFTLDVDLRPARNLIVRIRGSLNSSTGLLTWRLTSIDPLTGMLTENPLAGFLPPNRIPPAGQGSVLFTVMPKKGLSTESQIRNRARVVLDTNSPTDTPEWLNTLDNTKPASQVLPLAATQNLATFEVKWSGTDAGSGILDYTIFVSESSGPFAVWLRNTTANSGLFTGQSGKTYGFYSVARDRTGNPENAKTVAEATTQVSASARVVANVSAASFSGSALASEAIAAAFGIGLSTATQIATTIPLPTSLAGTTVRFKDSAGSERLAPLFFVSAGQINYQVPPGTATGMAIVTVTGGDGSISTGTIQVATVAPGLFSANSSGQGAAAAVALRVKADGSQSTDPVAQFDPAQGRFVTAPIDLGPTTDQVFLILFGTGIRFRSSPSAAMVRIGGVDAQVLFAGPAPGFVGLDQVNVLIPRSLIGRGEVDVVLVADGKVANLVKVSIR